MDLLAQKPMEPPLAKETTSDPTRKVGRNEPCPCGSGNKYKRCCLPAQEAAHLAALPPPPPPPVASDEVLLMGVSYTPYTVACLAEEKLSPGRGKVPAGLCTSYGMAKLAEDPASAGPDRALRKQIVDHLHSGWTLRKLAGMSTAAIEEQLRLFGVRHSQERFLQLAAGTTFAWSIATAWQAQDPLTCPIRSKDSDFLGPAACELWKRWLPERPSVEMIDDWMQEGYRLIGERRNGDACDQWWQVWSVLLPRLTPQMRTMDMTLPVFNGLQVLGNWLQDFELELLNAQREDPRQAERGVQLCRTWLAQFPDEADNNRMHMKKSLAVFLGHTGQGAEGLRLLEENIATWPEDPWTYVYAADAYADGFGDFGPDLRDRDRAVALLQQGIDRVPKNADDYGELTVRLRDLLA